MIICSFHCTGKTTTVGKYKDKNVIEIEDPDNKDFKNFYNKVIFYSNSGFVVLASCELKLLEKLKENNVEFTIVIPSKKKKNDFLQRSIDRGDPQVAYEIHRKKYKEDLEFIRNTYDNVVEIETNLEDYLLSKGIIK